MIDKIITFKVYSENGVPSITSRPWNVAETIDAIRTLEESFTERRKIEAIATQNGADWVGQLYADIEELRTYGQSLPEWNLT